MNDENRDPENAKKTLCDEYYEWCMDHPDPHRKTCGHYGPEFRVRVDAPIDKIADSLRQAGYEPTLERLDMLLREMQVDRFDDKHGGCPPDEVEDRIMSEAYESIAFLAESGEFEEE